MIGESSATLEFETDIDGIVVNGAVMFNKLEPMLPDELERVARLSPEDVDAIDRALLASLRVQGMKVNRIVAELMFRNDPLEGVPYAYFVSRLKVLASLRQLIVFGDLEYPMFTEVRLPPLAHTPS